MLLALVVSVKALAGAAIAVAGLVVLVVYLPVAVVREVTRPGDAPLPPWMGTVQARRARLQVVVAVLGGLAIGVVLAAMWGR